ncbi:hypothetical protein K466DRAFT_95246 [Polyporus arcularius HHB13444]|uniref:Uncharacterized protein n=1 Tax=Polyporus arcularius HHB13444 TaxID=1314778 RepID=A0A5C3NL66_9APHY|nr:hypothetical protein K466DRAFT_95246 [Polyporus arcularius HHB13444]
MSYSSPSQRPAPTHVCTVYPSLLQYNRALSLHNTRRRRQVRRSCRRRTSWIRITGDGVPVNTPVHCELVSPGIYSPSPFSSGTTSTVSLATTFPARDYHPANALPSHSYRNRSRHPHSLGLPSGIFASSSSSRAHSPLCTRRPVQRRLTDPVMRAPPLPSPEPRALPSLMAATERADASIPKARMTDRARDPETATTTAPSPLHV